MQWAFIRFNLEFGTPHVLYSESLLPTMSPDGKWIWNGSEWIPAPPSHDVAPAQAIGKEMIQVQPTQLVQPQTMMQQPSIQQPVIHPQQ